MKHPSEWPFDEFPKAVLTALMVFGLGGVVVAQPLVVVGVPRVFAGACGAAVIYATLNIGMLYVLTDPDPEGML